MAGRYWLESRNGVVLVFRNHHRELELVAETVRWAESRGKRVVVRDRPPEGWRVEDDAEVLLIDAQPVCHQLTFSLV